METRLQNGARRHGTPVSITEHPLFAMGVALWFAAALCLCTLAVRVTLLERMLHATHLGRVIGLFNPPIGTLSRLLIALLMGLLGGAIGWVCANKLLVTKAAETRPASVETPSRAAAGLARAAAFVHTESKPALRKGREMIEAFRVRRRDAHPDAPARAPISIYSELGESMTCRAESPREASPLAAPAPMALDNAAIIPPEAAPELIAPVQVAPTPVAAEPIAVEPAPVKTVTPEPVVPPTIVLSEPRRPVYPAPVAPAPVQVVPDARPCLADHIPSAPLAELNSLELLARLAGALEQRKASPRPTPPAPHANTSHADMANRLQEALSGLRALG